ncbi:hypothetical protein ACT3TQ_01300 [Halomonas sp. AOP12-C2-37]|uniref:hypothetical protein n=1 Tax=unclassified Halomonas TaxID=2609666 RepID=UPI0040349F63
MFPIRTAAFALIVLLAGCNQSTPNQQVSAPAEGAQAGAESSSPANVNELYSPLLKPKGKVTLSSCRMGGCAWNKWLSVKSISTSETEQTLEVTLLNGDSRLKDGEDSPTSPDGVAINWNVEPEVVNVTCSHTAPSVSGEALILSSETAVPGAMESAAELYFAACHSNFDGYSSGIETFSYDVE